MYLLLPLTNDHLSNVATISWQILLYLQCQELILGKIPVYTPLSIFQLDTGQLITTYETSSSTTKSDTLVTNEISEITPYQGSHQHTLDLYYRNSYTECHPEFLFFLSEAVPQRDPMFLFFLISPRFEFLGDGGDQSGVCCAQWKWVYPLGSFNLSPGPTHHLSGIMIVSATAFYSPIFFSA